MADEWNFEEIDMDAFMEESECAEDDPLSGISPVKKNMVLFFLIDVSSSMKGERIDTMNRAMREVLPDLINIGGTNTDVRVAVLEFGSGWNWVTPEPMLLEEYQNWRDLSADGVTDLGMALEELNVKMSRKQFLNSPSLSYAPVTFLITDGYPTDNYKKGLEILKKNKWFQAGIRVALALGSGVDKKILEEFTGDPEFVVEAKDTKMLYQLVRAISVTSSQIGSSSVPVEETADELSERDVEGTKQDMMRDALREIRGDIMAADMNDVDFDSGW
ncbi:MAG: VWA domain-containing protein [Clostridiales bacterium]|nr:VWA domain-containing protein [Clostridiales bacterium]